ncbi:hypothetical protein ABW19_dt0205878 [Dactylella cylindrospora]|nr:hypothetical protein ABW19_dt0205878 [Dactylella cylindrospora]
MEFTDNLSDEDMRIIYEQITFQENAKKLKGQKILYNIPREDLIRNLRRRKKADEGCVMSKATFDSAEVYVEPYPPSIEKIEDLEKMHIDDLRMEVKHSGRIIFLKTICDAKRLTSVTTIVEDDHGQATQLQVFNASRTRSLQEFLPKGQLLLIKEPSYKMSSTGTPSIRVDHLSDMILLADDELPVPNAWKTEEVPRGADMYKEIGNQALDSGRIREAIRIYSFALDLPDAHIGILLNRCLAYLKCEEYEHALRDAKEVLYFEKTNEKGLYRQAKALYQMRLFAQCGKTLTELIKAYPNNEEAKGDLATCRQRLEEQIFGRYDFKKMVQMAREYKQGIDFDFADYTVPVYAKRSRLGGNGLFTKGAVKAGDLLFCCKAFVNCHDKDNGISLTYQCDIGRVDTSSGAFLGNAVIDKLRRIPTYLPEFLKLHTSLNQPGNYPSQVEPFNTIVDSFLVNDITRLNSFSSVDFHDHFQELRFDEASKRHATREKTKENPYDPNCGVWLLPSYLNHSCVPNAHRTILGDMMILRAGIDMEKDTEIVISYTDTRQEIERRKPMIENNWLFTCQCKLCEFETGLSDQAKKQRDQIMGEMFNIVERVGNDDPTMKDADSLKALTVLLDKTYTISSIYMPRWYVGEHLVRLYSYYMGLGKPYEAYKALHMAPNAYGAAFDVTEGGVTFFHLGHACAQLVRAYARLAFITSKLEAPITESWKEAAKVVYRIVAGEDETFEEVFGRYIRADYEGVI